MLIVMHPHAPEGDLQKVTEAIEKLGFKPMVLPGAECTAIGVVGNHGRVDEAPFQDIKGIAQIIHVSKPYKLVSRDFHPKDTVINIGKGLKIGAKGSFTVMAGPCAIESHEQIMKTAKVLVKLGIPILRAGAYKPRTSPHSFQGMREEGLAILKDVGRETGLVTITEVMSPEHVERVAAAVDILQIGARNMQNYDLLREVGKCPKPVLLKRGLSATMEEWLAAAEYIMLEGNGNVMLCERGIRTFETATRNTADLAIIPLAQSISHLPVIFDPSHATGIRSLVAPMSLAAVVAGANGVMVEVHPDPDRAVSDGKQSLHFKDLQALMKKLDALVAFRREHLMS